MNTDPQDKAKLALLQMSLETAVPLHIESFKETSWDLIEERAKACGQIIAEKGDVILCRSKKKGETAKAFNALAEGIAALAFCPGGITIFDLHFEAEHPETTP
jgi:hypothetical protein